MKVVVFLICIALASVCHGGATFDLKGYQGTDGAISVHFNGAHVDPYFANKALVVAHQLGLDIDVVARDWIHWAVGRQERNGLFGRFCLLENEFSLCDKADADDAMLAIWLELLSVVKLELPESWQKSRLIALRYLMANLYDRQSQIYRISRENRVALLMDNVEVYGSLLALSRFYERRGDRDRARLMESNAATLKNGIKKSFWDEKTGMYRVSTQTLDASGFYPFRVAQIFPLLQSSLHFNADMSSYYRSWMKENEKIWMENGKIDYPWGLVALVSFKMNDYKTIHCWLLSAEPLRHGARWNVLEEAVFQGLSHKPGLVDYRGETC